MTSTTLTDSLETRFRHSLKKALQPGSHVILAVSGGSDSLGMMHLAATVAPEMKIRLAIGVVNHNLRTGVEQELELVKKQACDCDIPVCVLEVPKEDAQNAKLRGSIQAWARNARYKLLADLAEEIGASHIATAHTADDQAETVMLRILRGTGIDGMAGIREQRPLVPGIGLVRPLLSCSRSEIREHLRARNLSWAEDPSNSDKRYLRVRIRNELLPMMNTFQPGATRRVAALAEEAQGVTQFVDGEFINRGIRIKHLKLSSGRLLDSENIETLPDAAVNHVIRRALFSATGNLWSIERAHIAHIRRVMAEKKNTGVLPLPGQISVYAHRGSLYIFPTRLKETPHQMLCLSEAGESKWQAAFSATGTTLEVYTSNRDLAQRLQVRTRRPGDRLWQSNRKLKRYFNQKQIPRPYRDFVPLLTLDDAVISCPLFARSRHTELKTEWNWASDSPLNDIGIKIDKV